MIIFYKELLTMYVKFDICCQQNPNPYLGGVNCEAYFFCTRNCEAY